MWDSIKSRWDSIKSRWDSIKSRWDSIKSRLKLRWDSIKSRLKLRWDSTLSNISDFCGTYRDKEITRYYFLIVASVFGLWLGARVDQQTFCDLCQDETVAEYLTIAVVGIPALTFLWYFRTRDIRRKIQQNHLHNAIKNLGTECFTGKSFGVISLINLSQRTSEFNKLITIVFESKKRELNNIGSKGLDFDRRKLIEEISTWLSYHKKNKKIIDYISKKTVIFLLLIVFICVVVGFEVFVCPQFFYDLVWHETVAKYLATALLVF